MLLRRIFDPALAQASYLVGCDETREAVVIDPACDIDRYIAIAAETGHRIVAVAETHVHADFVSGIEGFVTHRPVTGYLSAEGPEPAWLASARLADGARVARIRAGDHFKVGHLAFTARHTPGHTRESLSFELAAPHAAAVGDGSEARPGGHTQLLFSGDFLFAGDVGRPDLGAFATEGLSLRDAIQAMRSSIAALDDLPAETQVLPGHGSGSACGTQICNLPATTIGIERVINRAMRAHAANGDFEGAVLDGTTAPPPYFARVKRLNEHGGRALATPPAVRELTSDEFAERCQDPRFTVIDTRPWNDYLDSRLPYSISAPFERSFGPTVANYLDEEDRVVLIAPAKQVPEIARVLWRVGVAPEVIEGFIEPATVSRLATGSFATSGVDDISPVHVHRLVEQGAATVIDVRTCHEYALGHLPSALHIPFTHLRARVDEVPPGKPVVCYCRSGNRSARAAAFLACLGHAAFNMRGGYWPYAGRGYEVAK
jgi:hydroxyacylglutathione hydrolase